MPPAFNLSQDQTLQFNLCFVSHLSMRRSCSITRRNWKGFLAFSAFLCSVSTSWFFWVLLDFNPSRRPHLSVRCFKFLKSFRRFVSAAKDWNHTRFKSVLQVVLKNFLFATSWRKTLLIKIGPLRNLMIGCGGRIWTSDLRVMSPTSCQLLHPAMCYKNYYTTKGICCQYI